MEVNKLEISKLTLYRFASLVKKCPMPKKEIGFLSLIMKFGFFGSQILSLDRFFL